MNNNVSRLLDVKFPEPNFANFNLGRKNIISADVGYLYPVYVEEVLPGSYKRIDVEALIQCNATVAPVMSSFTTKLEAFFIPLRIYYQHLLSNDRSNNFSDDFSLHYFPWLTYSNTRSQAPVGGYPKTNIPDRGYFVSAGSLIEYLGMFPSGWNSNVWSSASKQYPLDPINGIPFIGYFDIFRNYYANPYDPDVPFRVNNEINNSFAESIQTRPYDAYVPLSNFDSFINKIRKNSISAGVGGVNQPYGVNVLQAFFESFTHTLGNNSQAIPLFANQRSIYDDNDGSDPATPHATDNALHFGLLRRTYKDDYFNARISSDFVSYLKEQSKVLVQNNTFDITQLRLANRIAKYVDKLGFSDSRFGSWLKAHFGTRLNDRLDIPQFLGSISSTLAFEDIVSRAQTGSSDVITSNEALGSRAGLGAGYINNKGSFVEFKATEPGYIMVLFSIVPNVTYTQGIRKMYLKNRFSDLYTPEFDAVGYQDLHKFEMSALGYYTEPTNLLLQGPLDGSNNYVVGKQPSWMEYMTSIDEAHGLCQNFDDYGYWTLNRPYEPNSYYRYNPGVNLIDKSTYIFPEYFNNIFAVNKVTDNFQAQFRFYDKTSQPMSKQVLPRL